MMKDRNLKLSLIEYFVRRNWYPHLEVNVLAQTQISRAPKLVTDIDALALVPESTGKLQVVLGDCKTLKGQSPITRVLWMKGLMEYFGSNKGIIILTKEIEKEHQLTSDILNVQLFSDEDFEFYSRATADYTLPIESALTKTECWDSFFEIDKRFVTLKPLSEFSRTGFWNEKSSNYQVRLGLSILKNLKAELNPAVKLHLALVLHHFSLIAIGLNQIIIKLFTRYISLKSKDDLSDDLKVIIYGGIENYSFLNELRKKVSGSSLSEKELALPEWSSFVEFIRLAFENPTNFNSLPLFLKELSFCYLTAEPTGFTYANRIKDKDKYTSNFALRLCEYLTKACGLPPEFYDTFCKAIVFNEFDI